MEIIPSKLLPYNIGIDAGDDLTNIIFEKSSMIPNNKQISFIIPELDEEYNIIERGWVLDRKDNKIKTREAILADSN